MLVLRRRKVARQRAATLAEEARLREARLRDEAFDRRWAARAVSGIRLPRPKPELSAYQYAKPHPRAVPVDRTPLPVRRDNDSGDSIAPFVAGLAVGALFARDEESTIHPTVCEEKEEKFTSDGGSFGGAGASEGWGNDSATEVSRSND